MAQLESHGKSPETSFYWARSVLIRAGDIRTGGSLGPVESAIVSFIKTCQASLLEMVYFPVEPQDCLSLFHELFQENKDFTSNKGTN